jgi:hypothetical protein
VCCCLGRGFVSEGAGFEFCEDCWRYQLAHLSSPQRRRIQQTSQTINSPLFKLLERDIGRRRRNVEIESVLILDMLVRRRSELFLPMIERRAPLRFNS